MTNDMVERSDGGTLNRPAASSVGGTPDRMEGRQT
jgi:hypothetical protein